MMDVACRIVQRQLPSIDVGERLPARLDRHFSICLRCQAESSRYRKLSRSLAGLADVHETAPTGLVAAIERRIGVPQSAPSSLRPMVSARAVATVGALAAAAGTVAVVRLVKARSVA